MAEPGHHQRRAAEEPRPRRLALTGTLALTALRPSGLRLSEAADPEPAPPSRWFG